MNLVRTRLGVGSVFKVSADRSDADLIAGFEHKDAACPAEKLGVGTSEIRDSMVMRTSREGFDIGVVSAASRAGTRPEADTGSRSTSTSESTGRRDSRARQVCYRRRKGGE